MTRLVLIAVFLLIAFLVAWWWYRSSRIARIGSALVLMVLVGAWWYVFHTTAGVNFLLARLANLQTMRIDADGVSGTLAGPLKIARVAIDHPQAHIVAEDITLDPAPRAIFAQRVHVTSASIGRVEVNVKQSTEVATTPPRFFPSFLQLAVDHADVREVRVASGDTFSQTARRVTGKLEMTAQLLTVTDIQVAGPFYDATGTLALRARRPIDLRVTANTRMPAPRGAPFVANIDLQGPIDKLHLDAKLQAPSLAHVQLDILREGRTWRIVGEAVSERFALDPWLERPPFTLRDTALKLEWTPQGMHVSGETIAPEVDALPLALDFRGSYGGRVIGLTRGEIRPSKSEMVVTTAARIDLTQRRPMIAATAQWVNLRWPLRSDVFASPQGQLSIAGTLPFSVGVNGAVIARGVSGQLLAHGTLTNQNIDFDEMTLTTLGGEIKGAAALGFASPRAWRVDLIGTGINPAPLSAQLPGRIDFNIDARGTGLDAKSEFAITLSKLTGTLRGQALHGRGYLAHDAGGWSAREFALRLGEAQLAANGQWRNAIDLAWELDVPALNRFVSDAEGSVRFQGVAKGTAKAPQVSGSLIVTEARYGGWRAERLSLAGTLDLSDRLASQLELGAKQIGLTQYRFDTLHMRARGKTQAHAIDIEATAGGTVSKLVTRLDGAYRDKTWQGQFAPLALFDEEARAPTIESPPAQALISSTRAQIDNWCALWRDRRACGDAAWSRADGVRATLQSDPMPLSMFNDTFPAQSRYQGQWQINAQLSGRDAASFIGNALAQVSDASLTYQPIAGAEEIVKLGSGRIEVDARVDRVTGTLKIVTPGTTNIDAALRIERAATASLTAAPLSGELNAQTADANLLPLIFPDLDHSAGELNVRLRAAGTLAEPRMSGAIDFQKGELDLYRYNLSMRDLVASARIADNRLTFEGRARLGEGTLAMNGDLGWRKLDAVGSLRVRGDNLLVADLPEYRIVASPDVHFTIDGKRVDVRGEVLIPSAHIEPTDLRGAVQLSNDAYLIGERPSDAMGGFDVHSEVRVRVGDDVRLDTYGLQGKLGGAVTVISDNANAIGRGELNVSDGRYEAYGQKLDIARGRLLFDATPLDNPGLDIQAARQIEERRVGVNVRGTLRAPRVSVFSEPALPPSQVVSMLLTGKPIADLSTRDTTAVGAAQDDLRIQGGAVLAAQIGRRLGLEEVGVESSGLDDASLVLGKFLSPRLFVSYGISLTESINTLKLRYTLSEHWRIKAESGQHQSADVEFRVER